MNVMGECQTLFISLNWMESRLLRLYFKVIKLFLQSLPRIRWDKISIEFTRGAIFLFMLNVDAWLFIVLIFIKFGLFFIRRKVLMLLDIFITNFAQLLHIILCIFLVKLFKMNKSTDLVYNWFILLLRLLVSDQFKQFYIERERPYNKIHWNINRVIHHLLLIDCPF